MNSEAPADVRLQQALLPHHEEAVKTLKRQLADTQKLCDALLAPAMTELERLHEQTRADCQKALRAAKETLELSRVSTRAAVEHARLAGVSWADIGSALGMSRQGAWQRFHDLSPRP